MKVTKWDIFAIKAGTSRKFYFDTHQEMKSIQVYIYNDLNRLSSKPGDVEKYTTKYDAKENSLTVTAKKKEL